MKSEPNWKRMDARPRRQIVSLTQKALIPDKPGVYAFYHDGERLYVGKAGGKKHNLQGRLWGDHLRKTTSMTGSAFRRNVAEQLGIASPDAIKVGLYRPTRDDAARVTAFVANLEVAWIECKSDDAAVKLEKKLKAEFMPPLTKH